MASNPKSKQIAQVLTEKTADILAALRRGETLDDIGRPLGIFPFHIKKFYANVPETREVFREALEVGEKMRATAKPKDKKKRANGEAAALITRNLDQIIQMLKDGFLLGEIAELFELSRSSISEYMHSNGDELAARYEAALNEGGHALAEKSVAVTLRPIFDLTDAKTAELQARQLAWLASKRNSVYSDKQQIDLNHKVQGQVSIQINP